MAQQVQKGDRVMVTPKNPRAHGRGVGVVTYGGVMICRVKFDADPKAGGIACQVRDCEVIGSAVAAPGR